MSEQFHLLFVCTANICRSPIAAGLARLKISGSDLPGVCRLTVGGAGTEARDGRPIDPRAAAALGSFGVDATGFTSRALTAEVTEAADLVLTAQRLHRAAVVAAQPRSHVKVFTILEFARLVREVEPDSLADDGMVSRARGLVQEAARMRGLSPPPTPDSDDIADPFGRPAREFLYCAATIHAALERPLQLILGQQVPSGVDAPPPQAPSRPRRRTLLTLLPRRLGLDAFGHLINRT